MPSTKSLQLGQPGRGEVLGVRGRVVERPAGRAGQEHLRRAQVQPLVQVAQVGRLERLHERRRVAAVQAEPAQQGHQRLLQRQAELAEVGRVLGLGVDADGAPQLAAEPLAQPQHLLEGRHLEQPVVHGVLLADRRQPLDRPQRLELGQGEVVGQPAGHRDPVEGDRAPPVGELRLGGDIGRAGDLRLVPGDQMAVLGEDQVRLDEVGPHPGGELVRGERVLGPVPGRAAVADDQRPGPAAAARGRGGGRAGRQDRRTRHDRAGSDRERPPASDPCHRRDSSLGRCRSPPGLDTTGRVCRPYGHHVTIEETLPVDVRPRAFARTGRVGGERRR